MIELCGVKHCLAPHNLSICQSNRQNNLFIMDDYRFNSETDPTDEQLQQIMREAAQDAAERYTAAHNAYFAQISQMMQAL